MIPDEREFRERLTEIQARSGLSMRALSAAMGRDTGYVAALLDPSRPSRARPTPADLMAASNATGIAFVELLEALWGIDPERLAREIRGFPDIGSADARSRKLTAAERSLVADFAELLVARPSRPRS
jgi:transcriptional regulator with XRE-family HTH domain